MKHLIPLEIIEQKILMVRGHRVLLDRDLARLYEVETRVLNQAVRRNLERFPDDFIMVLTREEIMRISQIVTSSDLKFSKSVMAFTEEGVAMLSGILKSRRAVQVNIAIMRVFVRLRALMSSHADLARKLETLERKYDSQFKSVFDAIKMLMSPPPDPGPKKIPGFKLSWDKKNINITGMTTIYNEKGYVIGKGLYIGSMKEGKWTEHDNSGKLHGEYIYKKDNRNGPYKEYYQSGAIVEEGVFISGGEYAYKKGNYKTFYPSGKVKSECAGAENHGVRKLYGGLFRKRATKRGV